MQQALTKDARGFVNGIVDYLRRDSVASGDVPKVRELFRKVTSDARQEKYAQVESSVALTEKEKKSLALWLARLAGRQIQLVIRVNTKLLGGFRVTVGDWVVDTTLKHQLAKMTESLLA